MAIEKIIAGDSQESLLKEAGVLHTVFESSRHVKSAASRMFSREDLEKLAYEMPKGHFLSHMITLGSEERYGPNRNHDTWPHEELKKAHNTFVTHGRNYREHRNHDPALAIGIIKAAKYDEDLQRGEVVMYSDIDKAAGEFEKARKGEELSGSMAAKVSHDICTDCDFISKYAHERCDCIRCRPGSYNEAKQKYAHMRNFNPVFKDYSYVARPADRIAHYMNYRLPNEKAASAGTSLRGDQLADMYYQDRPATWLPVLKRIAAFDGPQDHPAKKAAVAHILPKAFDAQFNDELLSKMANHPHPARVMRSLIDRQMVMPLASFNSFVNNVGIRTSETSDVVKQASAMLPHIRATIIRGEIPDAFHEAVEEFEPSSQGSDDLIDNFLDDAREQFSLRYDALNKRCAYNETSLVKQASGSATPEARSLAYLYTAYLIKTAEHLGDDDWMVDGQLAFIR